MADEGKRSGAATQKSESVNIRRRQRPQLRVVFDTNILFTGSASDLVQQEAAKLILQSVFPDLEVEWYLPEIVRHERQYQMQKRALELLPSVAKVETLLGLKLNINEEILLDRVEKAVARHQNVLKLIPLKLDHTQIDWERILMDSAYRRPPFQDGIAEKGFRDALVVESFMQLVDASPKTATVCRLVLVTGDKLLTEAVGKRISGLANARVLSSLDELRGFVNTLVSTVDEAFISALRFKAEKLFWVSEDKSTLLYKERVQEKLREKFKAELAASPPGTSRNSGHWKLSPPSFARKVGVRVHWTSRIEIEIEATKLVTGGEIAISPLHLGAYSSPAFPSLGLEGSAFGAYRYIPPVTPGGVDITLKNWDEIMASRSVITHKGSDIYEVAWSADVTTSLELRRPSVDDIIHIETAWETVS